MSENQQSAGDGSDSDDLLATESKFFVTIQGPDDIEDFPTETAANKRAEELNAYFDRINDDDPNAPNLKAVVGFRRSG